MQPDIFVINVVTVLVLADWLGYHDLYQGWLGYEIQHVEPNQTIRGAS